MKRDLLKVQRLALHLSGAMPPRSFYDEPWKLHIYNIYTTFALFGFVSIVCTSLLPLYEYKTNMEMAISIIFQLTCATYTGTIAYFVVSRRKRILALFEKLGNGFTSHLSRIGLQERNESIAEAAFKLSNKITWILTVLSWFEAFIWEFSPYILGLINGKGDNEVGERKWTRFTLITWLPQNAGDSPRYEIIYLIECFCGCMIVTNFNSCNMLFYSVIFHIATHFKILAAAIEDFEKTVLIKKNADEEKTAKYTKSAGYNRSHDNHLKSEVHNDTSSGAGKQEKTESTGDRNRNSQTSLAPSNAVTIRPGVRDTFYNGDGTLENENVTGPADETEEEICYRYFLDCVKYHQAIYEFCEEANELFSPALFLFFMSTQVLLCLPAFMLALSDGFNGTLVKLIIAEVDNFLWPLLICWSADYLYDQNIAVKDALYGCEWYNRSPRFKKLLNFVLLRAQEPFRFSAGKFYVVSLESLGEIVNKVYAYYTMLRESQRK